ncbi:MULTISPECIES: hypothetical protein [unclassified Chryseobacterium]|uniref:hypothetical protein n=1 Tax=unclassified Chryseobacterium TaxID=2593645 RepID=UPI001F0AE852|nr:MULTISPECIES: hypothetical protein [unclassified Chryseobacterium]UMQ41583.1 hypothetical protein MKS83_19635 [Chryseobacterium sp. Y16C]
MKILNNAVEAIQIGLEDYKNEDPRRAQSALRNIFAGILLLFKEKLSRMSPKDSDEVLIKKDIRPVLNSEGDVLFKGKGDKTVDVSQIQQRFATLGVRVDWSVLNEIVVLRNTIEHYYTEKPPSVINEIVSKSFKIINDFCKNHLEEEPIELFGIDSWSVFLEADDIYEKEKKESVESLFKIDWTFPTLTGAIEHLRCPSCASDLIYAIQEQKYEPAREMTLNCKKCQNEFDFEDVIEECVKEELMGYAYMAATEGGDDPYDECPECGMSTYVFSEECCLHCGYRQKPASCLVCGTILDLYEAYEGDLCSYHKWSMEKSD